MILPARVVIVAAGQGRRFGGPKQFASLKGRSLLERCLDRFNSHAGIEDIVLVLNEAKPAEDFQDLYRKVSAVVAGGRERQDSVAAGIRSLVSEPGDVVLVHDGARPLITAALIDRVLEAARRTGAAVPVIPVDETIKRVENERILETLDRGGLRRTQTPQGFHYGILSAALERAGRENYIGTDEAVLVERMGLPVEAVPGERRNIKITTPEDLRIAEVWLER